MLLHKDRVAHLLRRTGFTASKAQVDALLPSTIPQIVDSLLNAAAVTPTPPVIENEDQYYNVRRRALPKWWLKFMATVSKPIQEKMVLFWHGHLTSAVHKVYIPEYMQKQNTLFRKHAMGKFRTLAFDISLDPAMMVWLDNNYNYKLSPNENYAREFMELFTLGLGNYTEKDVKEVARAFTGWSIDTTTLTAVHNLATYDGGQRTIFGQTASFNMFDTVNLIVRQPACAPFITTKLWEYFAYKNPPASVIQSLASTFASSDYDVKTLLRAMFVHEEFYADRAYRVLIKSPVEYFLWLHSTFPNAPWPSENGVIDTMISMGQLPFDPPHVAGWADGPAWLNSGLMFARYNYAESFVRTLTSTDLPQLTLTLPSAAVQPMMERLGLTDLSSTTSKQISDYLAAQDASTPPEQVIRGALHLLLICPEAQTK